jgi:hypothetical protein
MPDTVTVSVTSYDASGTTTGSVDSALFAGGVGNVILTANSNRRSILIDVIVGSDQTFLPQYHMTFGLGTAVEAQETTVMRADVLDLPYSQERPVAYRMLLSPALGTYENAGQIAVAIRSVLPPVTSPADVFQHITSLGTGSANFPAKDGAFIASVAHTTDDLRFTAKGNPSGEQSENKLIACAVGLDPDAPLILTVEIDYELVGAAAVLPWQMPEDGLIDLVAGWYVAMGGAFMSENPKHIKTAIEKAKKYVNTHPNAAKALTMVKSGLKTAGKTALNAAVPALIAAALAPFGI